MGTGSSDPHTGRQLTVVVMLFVRRAVGKIGGEKVKAMLSYGIEKVGMCSLETTNEVTSRQRAKWR